MSSARTGLPRSVILPEVERAVAEGLLHCDGVQLRPSAQGLRYLDELVLRFIA